MCLAACCGHLDNNVWNVRPLPCILIIIIYNRNWVLLDMGSDSWYCTPNVNSKHSTLSIQMQNDVLPHHAPLLSRIHLVRFADLFSLSVEFLTVIQSNVQLNDVSMMLMPVCVCVLCVCTLYTFIYLEKFK